MTTDSSLRWLDMEFSVLTTLFSSAVLPKEKRASRWLTVSLNATVLQQLLNINDSVIAASIRRSRYDGVQISFWRCSYENATFVRWVVDNVGAFIDAAKKGRSAPLRDEACARYRQRWTSPILYCSGDETRICTISVIQTWPEPNFQ